MFVVVVSKVRSYLVCFLIANGACCQDMTEQDLI